VIAINPKYSHAQFNLGVMYQHGQGVVQDEVSGAESYRKATEQGYAKAQHNLGVMYAQGAGCSLGSGMAW
jgi:TPR repeat protein